MRRTLLTVLIVCAAPLISDLVPESNAQSVIDTRELIKQRNIAGSTPKISQNLVKLLGKMKNAGVTGKGIGKLSADDFATLVVKVDDQGNVQVYVHMNETSGDEISQLEGLGFVPEVTNDDLKIAQGWLPHDSIEKAAELGFVTKITPPSYGFTR
ncbi:MAG TPA: hypothetical protein VHC46_05675, partial [Thermodesulfobacteriota bacterium]|nr:hypothetical protein [Thermodesulfobacteriota bacterium]